MFRTTYISLDTIYQTLQGFRASKTDLTEAIAKTSRQLGFRDWREEVESKIIYEFDISIQYLWEANRKALVDQFRQRFYAPIFKTRIDSKPVSASTIPSNITTPHGPLSEAGLGKRSAEKAGLTHNPRPTQRCRIESTTTPTFSTYAPQTTTTQTYTTTHPSTADARSFASTPPLSLLPPLSLSCDIFVSQSQQGNSYVAQPKPLPSRLPQKRFEFISYPDQTSPEASQEDTEISIPISPHYPGVVLSSLVPSSASPHDLQGALDRRTYNQGNTEGRNAGKKGTMRLTFSEDDNPYYVSGYNTAYDAAWGEKSADEQAYCQGTWKGRAGALADIALVKKGSTLSQKEFPSDTSPAYIDGYRKGYIAVISQKRFRKINANVVFGRAVYPESSAVTSVARASQEKPTHDLGSVEPTQEAASEHLMRRESIANIIDFSLFSPSLFSTSPLMQEQDVAGEKTTDAANKKL